MRSRTAAILLALGAILLPLAACGDGDGGGDGTTSSGAASGSTDARPGYGGSAGGSDAGEEDATPAVGPEQVVEDFLVSGDSAKVCETEISPELLAATYGDLSGCRNGRPTQSLASKIEFQDLSETGETATAIAVPKGGTYDGVPVAFTLELDGDRWVITKVKADIPVGP